MGWSPNPGGESNGTRGQSETIAVVLIIGIALVATTAIIAFGSSALTDTEQQAQNGRAEDAMTQFDSRAAEVALGDSEIQSVDFGQRSGNYDVRPNAGSITIVHANYDGTDDDGNHVYDAGNDDDERIYTGALGAVVYHNGETEIAYQGGGVWRKGPSGTAVMISPPEFHYRSGTLTLPVIQAQGDASHSGATRAVVKDSGSLTQRFPNEANSYAAGGSPPPGYLNPLSQGNVYITVQSDYYEAWAAFFRSRSDGAVSVDHTNQEVELELITKGQTGVYQVPADSANGGGSLEIRGIAPGHTLDAYDFTIVGKENQNSRFKNLRWSQWAAEGSRHFEIAFPSGNVDCGDEAHPVIYYSWMDGTDRKFQSWRSVDGYDVTCTSVGGGKEKAQVTLDLTDASKEFEYQQISGSDLAHFNSEVGSADFVDPGELEDHPAADPGDDHAPDSVTVGDRRNSEYLIQHYFAVMGPDFELQTEDQQSGNAAGVDEGDHASAGYVDYPGGDRVITYLHITENRIQVEFETD